MYIDKLHRWLSLSLGGNHIRLGELGRQAFSNDPEVTLTMVESGEYDSGGWRLSMTWEGPSDRVFEDCFDFRKYLNTEVYLFFFRFYKLHQ